MRSCRKPFEYAYVTVGGDVRLCCFNHIVVGNLLENTLEEIWNGKIAENVRKSFMKGELLGCNELCCPDCLANNGVLEMNPAEVEKIYNEMGKLPIDISLAYDERCNHACPSCRHEILVPDKEYIKNTEIITKNIEPYLENVRFMAANGIGDLFVTTEIVDMIAKLNPKRDDFSFFLETNGVLFKENWHKFKNLAGKDITVSVTPNSFDKETYRYLAGRDDLEKFEENLTFISDLKHKGDISRIRLIMVVQDSNFRQIPQFIKKGIEYDVDDIVLRPIYHWFGMSEDEVLFKDVLNPCHPYHKEYLEIIEDPICYDSRVFDWGFRIPHAAVEFPTLQMKRYYENSINEEKLIDQALEKIVSSICETNKKIVVYGAGKIGKKVFDKLMCGESIMDVVCLATTNDNKKTEFYMGKPIVCIDDIIGIEQYQIIIATVNPNFQQEMIDHCKKIGICEYACIL